MKISIATRPGSPTRPNEDFVAACPAAAVVLDGLTAPAELGTGCIHGTAWYVTQLGTELHRTAATTASPLDEHLAWAIEHVAGLHAHTCDLAHPGTPSSSVVLLRHHNDELHYLILFDSTILLDGPNGPHPVTDHRINAIAQAERSATRSHPIGSPQHTQAVHDLVAAERRHRNQPDGYWVAGATPEAARHAMTGSTPTARTRRAALLTDGASCLVDNYQQLDWTELLDLLEHPGPEHLLDAVRRAESDDPRGTRWPRYKQSDDATVAYCSLIPSARHRRGHR